MCDILGELMAHKRLSGCDDEVEKRCDVTESSSTVSCKPADYRYAVCNGIAVLQGPLPLTLALQVVSIHSIHPPKNPWSEV